MTPAHNSTLAKSPIIRAVNLTRKFGDMTAVDHFNIEVARGEIFGLVGPDGAGKTTTLRLLCGLLDPTEGEAWVAGHNVARELDAVKDRIGYMAQRFGLYGDLTVDENMFFYADLFGLSQDRARTPDPAVAPHDAHGAFPQTPRRQSFRRHEAEARAHVHAAASSAGAVS